MRRYIYSNLNLPTSYNRDVYSKSYHRHSGRPETATRDLVNVAPLAKKVIDSRPRSSTALRPGCEPDPLVDVSRLPPVPLSIVTALLLISVGPLFAPALRSADRRAMNRAA